MRIGTEMGSFTSVQRRRAWLIRCDSAGLRRDNISPLGLRSAVICGEPCIFKPPDGVLELVCHVVTQSG